MRLILNLFMHFIIIILYAEIKVMGGNLIFAVGTKKCCKLQTETRVVKSW